MARAGQPVFFTRLAVPDTMDGRFDLVALHAWLVLDRNRGRAAAAQALTDDVFIGFDEALREQGTGDMGMGRRLKAMAKRLLWPPGGLSGCRDAGRACRGGLAQCLSWRGGVAWRRPAPWLPMRRPRAQRLAAATLLEACWISGRCRLSEVP